MMLAVVHGWRAYLHQRRHLDAAGEADRDARLSNADAYYLQV